MKSDHTEPRTFKQRLKDAIERPETRIGRACALTIQGLILFSLVTFSIETLPRLSSAARQWLYVAEAATVAVFTVEYVLRLYAADRRLRFVFSFFGLVDLLAILPFYVAAGIDLRAIRVFRMLRLVRILKMARYNRAMQHLRDAFMSVREELAIYLVATGMVLFVASVGIYYFERDAQPDKFASVFHAMWWAMATLTTVGYGDVYPVTAGGRIFTGLLLFVVLGIVAVPSGILAAALTNTRRQANEKYDDSNVASSGHRGPHVVIDGNSALGHSRRSTP